MRPLIFNGHVEHVRRTPVEHRFRTPVTFYAFDLEEIESLSRSVSGFRHNQFAPVSLHDRDYLAPGDAELREKLYPWSRQILPDGEIHRITMVTAAAWWGRVFNPVSFYIIDRADGQPAGLVAEVNNTFGDRHVYAVPLNAARPVAEGQHEKQFHVSPFNDMNGSYRFTVRRDGQELYVGVDLYRDGEKILEAWMEGIGEPLTSSSLRRINLLHPLRPWLTMPRIAWQAMFLKFKHKLPVFKRPVPDHPSTIIQREESP